MNVQKFYSDLIFRRKYARHQNETWEQAVKRYANHFRVYAKELKVLPQFDYAIELFKNKEIVGSMRGLAMAGKPLSLYPAAVYNCSYITFDDWASFADMFLLLMLGVGVGYTVENHTQHIPPRPNEFRTADITIVVGDSKEGWRDSFYSLLQLLQSGIIPSIDYSQIRKAGEPLKTFGGTASGPEPLKNLFENVIKLFVEHPGEPWRAIELFDIANFIANCVISGGVRRSACIGLVDKDDVFSFKPKNFYDTHPWRSFSNISIADINKSDIPELVRYWKENQTGEPGIFNRKVAQKKLLQVGRELGDDRLGTNPCFLGHMPLLTDEGYKSFENLDGNIVKVWSPLDNEYVLAKVFKTGNKRAISLYLSNNETLELTPDHRLMDAETEDWVEAKDSLGHRILHHSYYEIKSNEYYDLLWLKLGFIQGDSSLTTIDTHGTLLIHLGTKDSEIKELFGVSDMFKRHYYTHDYIDEIHKYGFYKLPLPERPLPDKLPTDDKLKLASFLRGLYSANGSVITHHRIALKTSNSQLAYEVKRLLKVHFGIDAYITTNKAHDVKFSNGVYTCKESYDVNISRAESIFEFAQKIGFIHKYKQEALKDLIKEKSPKVLRIEDIGYHDVYDFSMEKTHAGVVNGLIVHNCGEIILRPYGTCNLTEVHVKPNDTLDMLIDKVIAAATLGMVQGYVIEYPELLHKEWSIQAEAEPLLGVSLTGLRTHPVLGEPTEEATRWLRAMRTAVHEYVKKVGAKVGRKYTAVTTVKPSGTVSQVLGTSAGLHNAYGRYVIKRLRLTKTDPILEDLKKYPIKIVDDIYNTSSVVLEFPLEYPYYKPRDIKNQLDYYLMLSKYWTDHNPSATITVENDEEWNYVEQWLQEHLDEIIGLTFLPTSHKYELAPFEVVDEETYKKLLEPWKKQQKQELKFSLSTENLNGIEYACTAGYCEVEEL